jgi:mRNA interferase RelE/StbE
LLKLNLSKKAYLFIENLKKGQPKHARQIVDKLESLKGDPYPSDSKKLKGDLKIFHRVSIGEYRILYRLDEDNKILFIYLIGKRNDSEIYKY